LPFLTPSAKARLWRSVYEINARERFLGVILLKNPQRAIRGGIKKKRKKKFNKIEQKKYF
jgi:hypothetical protein